MYAQISEVWGRGIGVSYCGVLSFSWDMVTQLCYYQCNLNYLS